MVSLPLSSRQIGTIVDKDAQRHSSVIQLLLITINYGAKHQITARCGICQPAHSTPLTFKHLYHNLHIINFILRYNEI